MKHLPTVFFLAWLGIFAFILPAQAQDGRHYTCYRTSGPIRVDGVLNEPDWGKSAWSEDFVDITGNPGQRPWFRTRIKLLWDDEYLYLAARLEESDIWATIKKRDEVIFQDNDFELFLDPDGNGLNYYEIEVNALGTIWDLMLTRAYKAGGIPINSWDMKGLKSAISVNGSLNDPSSPDSAWCIEMALPIKELMHGKSLLSRPADGVQWRINFSRVEWHTEIRGTAYHKITDSITGKPRPEENWVWSPTREVNMHIPERWGRLEFSSANISPEPFHFKTEGQKNNFRIWLWMGAHELWSPAQWDSVLKEFRAAGVYGILTQASGATLARMIPIANKFGIKVEKWFIAMMNNDTNLIREHPDWFVVSRQGKSSITNPAYVGYYRFLCPANPEVRRYLKSRLDEYLSIPGLDGIHLDYIRYPDVILPQALWSTYGIIQDKEYAPYDYCYCSTCREKFRAAYGADPLAMEHPEQGADWRQFRLDQVSSLVDELADYCHVGGKRISAAVFPGPGISKQLVRQEWNRWPLDEVISMLYQNCYFGSLDWIGSETAEGVKALNPSVPLCSGLYIPALTPRDLHTAIAKSIAAGAGGITLFTYESMTPMHWEVLKALGRGVE